MPKKFERCIRKVRKSIRKRKYKANPYAICSKVLFRNTTRVNDHKHRWMRGRSYTTISGKIVMHKHRVSVKKKIALPNFRGGHSHKLL